MCEHVGQSCSTNYFDSFVFKLLVCYKNTKMLNTNDPKWNLNRVIYLSCFFCVEWFKEIIPTWRLCISYHATAEWTLILNLVII